MMLLRSQSILYFNVKHTINWLEQWTGNSKAAGSNLARGQFFATKKKETEKITLFSLYLLYLYHV